MRPTNDPRWNREYVEQRLREKKVDAELKRIADRPVEVDNSAEFWFGEYLNAENRCTRLESENEKLKLIIKAIRAMIPTSRTTTITEVW